MIARAESDRTRDVPVLRGWSDGRLVSRASVLLAIDRPARLELEWCELDPRAARPHPSPPLRNLPAELVAGGRTLFRGSVESVFFRGREGGWRGGVLAWSDWDSRRGKCAARHHHVSDSELATRIALELGLRPEVEATPEIHERIEINGDPLRFLRERARAIGFELAIAEDVLHFRSALEPTKGPAIRIEARRDILEVELEERLRGRGGRIVFRGRPRVRPLDAVEIAGLGPGRDGRYAALRCRHRYEEGRWTNEVEFLERGADLERWRGRVQT